MSQKREEAIKDRFVQYLRKVDGSTWETVARDMPTKGGNKNFESAFTELDEYFIDVGHFASRYRTIRILPQTSSLS